MILIRLMGGLGNQMFQYAFAYSLALKNNTVLKIDISLLQDKSQPHEIVTHRDFLLDEVFNFPFEMASKSEIEYFNGKIYQSYLGKVYNKILWQLKKHRLIIEKNRGFNPEFLQLKDNICLVGAFQCEKYFCNEITIKKLFNFKYCILPISENLSEELKTQNSIAIHIRRGDYVSSTIYSKTIGVLPEEYYLRGIELMKQKIENPKFYIFSDDISWCKKTFTNLETNIHFVDDEHVGPHTRNYFQLLTLCKHFIISNSTYSWWGAWLSGNKEKIVIAPKMWFVEKNLNGKDIVPENWIKI